MKVGFVAPLSIAAVNGGVRTQALQTAKHLKDLGIEIEFISPWQYKIESDLIHVFTSTIDVLSITKKLKELEKKVIVSPVFYSNRSGKTISAALKGEKLLSIAGSGIRSEFGIKSEIFSAADFLLPNTQSEADLIISGFNYPENKITVIPNAVENSFAEATPDLFLERYGIKDFVLFAGQAGAKRKNVLSLLKASEKFNSKLVIIGSFYDDEYGNKCRKLASDSDDILLIETLSHDSELLKSAYAACHTFVLPSQFETPGIAAMEAALAGANLSITEKGGTKEYFKDFANYLDPSSEKSISNAINESLSKQKSETLKNHILTNYTWDKVAKQTLGVYRSLIN